MRGKAESINPVCEKWSGIFKKFAGEGSRLLFKAEERSLFFLQMHTYFGEI